MIFAASDRIGFVTNEKLILDEIRSSKSRLASPVQTNNLASPEIMKLHLRLACILLLGSLDGGCISIQNDNAPEPASMTTVGNDYVTINTVVHPEGKYVPLPLDGN